MPKDDEGTLDGQDVFNDAFDQAEGIVPGDKPDLSAGDNPDNIKDDEPPRDELKDEPPKDEPPKDEIPPADEKRDKKPDESEETYEQRWKTLQGIHRHDRETWAAEKADLEAKLKAGKPDEVKEVKKEEKDTSIAPDLYDSLTEEEKAALKEYDEEFDVVSKMEGKKRAVELNRLRKEFQAWKDEITAQLAPATALVKESQTEREERATKSHFDTIREAHEDFEAHRDSGKIKEWIATKPKYLQKSMMATYSGGSAEEVVDLITDFKRENNIPLKQNPPDNVVNIKKGEKRQNLTAVSTRRGAVNAGASPANDYDSAFDEAINKQGG